MYRSLLAGKRVLIVADNARDAGQIRPLLPGFPGCMVLVTSRNRLIGLAAAEGAQLITLDVLPDGEARELLTQRIGTGGPWLSRMRSVSWPSYAGGCRWHWVSPRRGPSPGLPCH